MSALRLSVALRGHGTTDLAAGLREAAIQLASTVADERMVILLSDCLHTAGDEPADALAGIDRLHVLVPLGGVEAEAAWRTSARPSMSASRRSRRCSAGGRAGSECGRWWRGPGGSRPGRGPKLLAPSTWGNWLWVAITGAAALALLLIGLIVRALSP